MAQPTPSARRLARSRRAPWILAPLLGLAPLLLCGADWARFRGPDGSGRAGPETEIPVRWSDGDGVVWKLELPGPGSSSPIVSRGRVFVTCYSGYGVGRRGGGEIDDLRRHVVCADERTGKLLWDRSIESKLPEERFEGIGVPNHGYASSTPVADGERVYAFFGRSGVVAYDLDGEEKWRAAVDPDPRTNNFGSASSPVLWGDLLIVPASVECEAIVAFDKRTGREVWRAPAAGYGAWWGTPVVAEAGGETELIVSVPGEVWALNPENGKLRWYAESFPERAICPSVVLADGIAYAIGGRSGGAVAVRAGGRGDVSRSHVVWKSSRGSYVTSPVVHEKHVYWVNDRGVAYCLEAETGKQVYEERIDGASSVYASPVLAGGKLYVVSRRNGTFVLDASPTFRAPSRNALASDDSDFNASPVPSGSRLLIRSNRFLYNIGKPSA